MNLHSHPFVARNIITVLLILNWIPWLHFFASRWHDKINSAVFDTAKITPSSKNLWPVMWNWLSSNSLLLIQRYMQESIKKSRNLYSSLLPESLFSACMFCKVCVVLPLCLSDCLATFFLFPFPPLSVCSPFPLRQPPSIHFTFLSPRDFGWSLRPLRSCLGKTAVKHGWHPETASSLLNLALVLNSLKLSMVVFNFFLTKKSSQFA